MKGLIDVASVLLCLGLKLFLLGKKNTKSLAILCLKCKSINITLLFIELLYESLWLNHIMLVYSQNTLSSFELLYYFLNTPFTWRSQWWSVTKYNYFVTVLKYIFQVSVLYWSSFILSNFYFYFTTFQSIRSYFLLHYIS